LSNLHVIWGNIYGHNISSKFDNQQNCLTHFRVMSLCTKNGKFILSALLLKQLLSNPRETWGKYLWANHSNLHTHFTVMALDFYKHALLVCSFNGRILCQMHYILKTFFIINPWCRHKKKRKKQNVDDVDTAVLLNILSKYSFVDEIILFSCPGIIPFYKTRVNPYTLQMTKLLTITCLVLNKWRSNWSN